MPKVLQTLRKRKKKGSKENFSLSWKRIMDKKSEERTSMFHWDTLKCLKLLVYLCWVNCLLLSTKKDVADVKMLLIFWKPKLPITILIPVLQNKDNDLHTLFKKVGKYFKLERVLKCFIDNILAETFYFQSKYTKTNMNEQQPLKKRERNITWYLMYITWKQIFKKLFWNYW